MFHTQCVQRWEKDHLGVSFVVAGPTSGTVPLISAFCRFPIVCRLREARDGVVRLRPLVVVRLHGAQPARPGRHRGVGGVDAPVQDGDEVGGRERRRPDEQRRWDQGGAPCFASA